MMQAARDGDPRSGSFAQETEREVLQAEGPTHRWASMDNRWDGRPYVDCGDTAGLPGNSKGRREETPLQRSNTTAVSCTLWYPARRRAGVIAVEGRGDAHLGMNPLPTRWLGTTPAFVEHRGHHLIVQALREMTRLFVPQSTKTRMLRG